MINRTRITVDEATRDVLDQLSTELSRTPSWTLTFGEDLSLAVADVFREGLADQAQILESLAGSSHAVQAQIGQQVDCLTAVGTQIQTLVARTEVLQDQSRGQDGRLSGVQASLERMDERFDQQAQAVDRFFQGLTTELSRTPSWTLKFGKDLSQAIADAFREGLAGQSRILENLAGSTHALQVQVGKQADCLAAVGTQIQNLVARTEALQDESSGLAERLSGLQALLERMDERFDRQSQAVDRLVQGLTRLAELTTQGSSMVAEQRQVIDALRDDCRTMSGRQEAGQAELADALTQLATTLCDVRSEQAAHHDALEMVASGLDSLSRPWWQRIFSSRGKKS